MIARLVRALFGDRSDVGLQIEAEKFGRKQTFSGLDQDKQTAAFKAHAQRTTARRKVEAGTGRRRRRTDREATKLRAVK